VSNRSSNCRITQHLYALEDSTLASELDDQLRFDWAAQLVAPDYAQIYTQASSYFADRGDRLRDLSWRAFEKFLASIFEAQGYETLLGAGGNDGGVDLRLTRNAVYGEQVTIVQAKRYSKRPIIIELVSSTLGVSVVEQADQALYVTTSRYLPSVIRFAARSQGRLQLAAPAEVAAWSEIISASTNWRADPTAVLAATTHAGMVLTQWAVPVATTPTAARLALLDTLRTHDPADNGSIGVEMPDLTTPLSPARTITARRCADGAWVGDDRETYFPWKGEPRHYDLND
jgi:hypothetical protein